MSRERQLAARDLVPHGLSAQRLHREVAQHDINARVLQDPVQCGLRLRDPGVRGIQFGSRRPSDADRLHSVVTLIKTHGDGSLASEFAIVLWRNPSHSLRAVVPIKIVCVPAGKKYPHPVRVF